MPNPNDLNYSDLTDTPPNPLPSPPPNPGRPSRGMPGEENIAANNDRPLPGPIKGDAPWQIELRYLPIGPRGHAYFVLVDPQGNLREELHGLAYSRNTGNEQIMGKDGDRLMGFRASVKPKMGWQPLVGHVGDGSYEDIVQNKEGTGRWQSAKDALKAINEQNFDYKADDPAFEFGLSGSGGQIQNSNSVAYTLLRRMASNPKDDPVAQQGWQDKFPGWGRDLLNPNYRPYRYPITAVEDPSLRQGSSP
ncbi:MAG: hypothetical protein J0H44_15400 [Alphaproteobacteria bacterium]|nr:hypothetical protein [Alphaproteobacteria bacterium]